MSEAVVFPIQLEWFTALSTETFCTLYCLSSRCLHLPLLLHKRYMLERHRELQPSSDDRRSRHRRQTLSGWSRRELTAMFRAFSSSFNLKVIKLDPSPDRCGSSGPMWIFRTDVDQSGPMWIKSDRCGFSGPMWTVSMVPIG